MRTRRNDLLKESLIKTREASPQISAALTAEEPKVVSTPLMDHIVNEVQVKQEGKIKHVLCSTRKKKQKLSALFIYRYIRKV